MKWIKPDKDLPFEGEPVEVTYKLSDGQGKKVSIGKLRVNVVDGVRQHTWDIFIPEQHREINFYARVIIAWRKPVPADD